MKAQNRILSVEVGITIAVLLIVVLANVLASQLVRENGLTVDTTYQQAFTLTDTTEVVLAGLQQDVEIDYLGTETDGDSNILRTLALYDAASDLIHVSYIDLTLNPAYATAYEQKGTPVSSYGLVVRSGNKERIYTANDLYELSSASDGSYSVTAFLAEQRLTAALVAVTGDDHLLAFSKGHDEAVPDTLNALCTSCGFSVSDVTLTVQELPQDLELLVIAAPARDFTQTELGKLDAFLQTGGSLMVFLPPAEQSLPNLDAFLQEWGIGFSNLVVCEPQMQYGSETNIVPMYYSHLINDYFADNSVFMVLPQVQALALLTGTDKTVSPVLVSTADSYAVVGRETQPGPFYLALTSEAAAAQGSGRIFAIGSSQFFALPELMSGSFSNREFLTQVMDWCVPELDAVSIPPKSLTAPALAITGQRAWALSAVVSIVVPLAVLLCGIVVWLKRRRL